MLYWLCSLLILIIIILGIQIFLLRKSAREIRRSFADRLAADTNTLIDISSTDKEMRQLAADINTQLRKLRSERHRFQQGDQELKNAVANISHDLRTPLTAICGYLDLLAQEEKSETAERYIAQIKNRTEALKQLTEELFTYSVISSTKQEALEQLDLRRPLEESLMSFYGALQQKGIVPEICLPDTRVERTLDAAALERIFGNILNNALKYSDGDLSVSMDAEGTIIFANTAKNLTPVTVGRLFDRFYTVETGRSATGLGLSIARLLTERMGGTISADYRDEKLYITVVFF